MKLSQVKRIISIAVGALLLVVGLFYVRKAARYVERRVPFLVAEAEESVWRKVQEHADNSVVQVFVDVAYFNWVEPYKSPDQSRSRGSGFFINDKGYLATNYHVVDEATTVKIQVPALGREQFDVEIVGVCPRADVALLKLKDESLKKIKKVLGKIKFLELGNSDKVVRTQEILALGYPLGQEKLKSSKGIVSGRERVWGESYIQTTVPINEGNSGGPSLDADGKVIGINTASIAAAENVGYIIPVNDVKHIIKQLYEKKFLRKPILGCELNNATHEMITYLGNPKPGGVHVARVHKNSLMDRAGVQAGDMFYNVNGYTIDRYGEVSVPWIEDKIHLRDVVNRFKIGDKINFTLYRKGKKIDIDVDFKFVNLLPIRVMYPEYEKMDYEIIAGLVVMELQLNHIHLFRGRNSQLVKYLKKENRYEPALLITHIFPGSQTKHARSIFRGNLIEEVNGEPVKTLKDFREILLKNKDSNYMTIKSDKKRLMVLSLKKVLNDEDRLARTYLYRKSKLCQALQVKFAI